MTTTRRIGVWRRWAGAAQAAAFASLPFLRIRGESALRFDVPSLRLHFFGATLWMGEFFVLLLATLAFVFLFLLVTLVFGRVWCGWACPQTLLSDLTGALASERRRRKRRPVRLAGAWVLLVLVSALFSAATLWYFVEPLEFFGRLGRGDLGPVLSIAWAVLFAVLLLDLGFVRGTFCATTCPYAKLQGVLFDANTLVVAYDSRRDDECVDCGACVRVCPTGIDIRNGLQAACIHCAACVDACAPVLARFDRETLVDYFFGEPGTPPRWWRPGVLALSIATGVALAGTVTAAVETARSTLDLSVALASQVRPRRTDDGRVVNAYSVALENRGRQSLTVRLSLAAPGAEPRLRPEEIALAPGEHRAATVVATFRGEKPGIGSAELTAQASGIPPVHARVPLVVPGGP